VTTGPEVRAVLAASAVPEWERLADRLAGSPFLRPGWVLPWQRTWGRGRRLVLLGAYARGGLVGALPLMVRAGVAASPTNWHTPEYGVLAEDADVQRTLLEAAVRAGRHRTQLGFVDEGTAAVAAELAAGRGGATATRVLARGPYVDLAPGFGHYESSLDRRMRSDLRRRRRRLDEVGEVAVEVVEEADRAVLQEVFRVESLGWKGAAGTAILADRGTQRFYSEVAGWAAARGWLRVAVLRIAGRVVACDLALEAGGVHYLLKTGFDPDYRRFAPGKLLRLAMLERAHREGLRRYEFLGVDDPWKQEWTSTVHPRLLVQAFAPTAVGRADRLVQVHAREVARRVVAQGRALRRR
jgi:CelD/BcsL family acetyltransferase involved in cellulose biosynthesis